MVEVAAAGQPALEDVDARPPLLLAHRARADACLAVLAVPAEVQPALTAPAEPQVPVDKDTRWLLDVVASLSNAAEAW